MWKESIVMACIGLFHHERRKRVLPTEIDRRKDNCRMNMKTARRVLDESLDKFSETVIFKK